MLRESIATYLNTAILNSAKVRFMVQQRWDEDEDAARLFHLGKGAGWTIPFVVLSKGRLISPGKS